MMFCCLPGWTRLPLILLVTSLPIGVLAQTNGVLREVYTGIAGTAVSDLTNSPSFPNSPASTSILNTFEAPTDVDDEYGQRLTAYVVPPTTGNYVFWIASDDNSALFLSTDSSPANRRQVASVSGWTNPREWTKYPEQISAPVALTAGQNYYIEALMKEEGGGDNLAVRWQLPSGVIEEPISANRLIVYGLGPPQITKQPANATVIEGGSATFSVQLARLVGATYQWLRGAASIPGATNSSYTMGPVALSDSGAQFNCYIANAQGSTNSSPATLTVLPDTTPPTLVSVANLGDDTLLTILFSEPVEAASATNPLNYNINNGVSVSGASFGGDTRSIVLHTSPMQDGALYTLTVNNVRDRAATPNTIAPNTQRTFTLDFTPLDISSLSLNREPIGPCSRRTGLVISEIMYHPTNCPDGKVLEFIELYNSQVFAEDISGYRLSGQVDYTFPTNKTIAAGGYLVVAPVPADVQSVYGISGVLGGFTNRLSNGSRTIRLRNAFGAVLLEANYSGDSPWPIAAAGAGHSLVLARPTYGEANPEAWEASDRVGGSPGAAETTAYNPYQSVVINEFLAHTDPPDYDYVELYNYSASPVDLTGCILTDKADTNLFVLPSVTIPARGFLVFYETNMGFALSAEGESIYFKDPAGTKVIDAVRFKGQENGVATGRYPDGAPGFCRLRAKTPGMSNARELVSDVVINELMYNPISGNSEDEFIELYNRGSRALNLAGWRLSDAVSFTFPSNAAIPAGGYLVIANKASRLLTNYTGLSAANTLGDYGGALGNGARLALSMPDEVVTTNGEARVTNVIHITMDEVTFKRGGRWGKWADGGGGSLELVDAHSNHRLASNWADSDETTKSGWTNIEYTGVLDNGNGAADSLQLFLQGAGECLVDNVEVFASGGANLLANPNFESGFDNWYPQGTHDQSYWQTTGGYGGGKCLHIVATGRGDTGANRMRTPLTTTLGAGTVATIRAKVRWLKGNPEILLRLHGDWLEAFGNIAGARNLGTPGAANSQARANTGPAIHDVCHRPILPAAGQAVTVRAQVGDPDGLAALVLRYRVDPGTNYTDLGMTYNGAGIYTATIPGQGASALVAFCIRAADNASVPATSQFPNDAPARECLVRFGESVPSTGRVGTYRFWITQASNNRWTTREKNSNEPLDATFVYGNSRVVYNIGALYSGSPWHTPGYNGPLNNICDYVLAFPEDDLMLGTTDFVLASLGNLDNDNTAQREQAAFWMLGKLGVPTLNRRHVNLFVNGVRRGLAYEDAQQPSSEVVHEWFPDDPNGDLHKIEDWFEFDTTGDAQLFNVDATLQDFTTTGGAKKLARYRWNWRKRAVNDSANDYAKLFEIVNAVNATQPEPYNTQVQRVMDYEEWARVMALEHLVGNWDSYGYNRGKNMYAYKPEAGKWTLLAWDIDFVLDNGGDPATTDLNPASMPMNEPVMRTLLTFPPVQRAWWRALQDAVNGPMAYANVSAMMNAKYQGLAAAGLSVAAPTGPLSYISSRRTYIQGLLSSVASPFSLLTASFSTNRNYISILGTAPISVCTITMNGVTFPVTWTSISNWTAKVALGTGANVLNIAGLDRAGNPVAGATGSVTVTYTGATELAQDHIVLNEIMYNPALPDTGFIELYNTSATCAFDLSGFQLKGADFTFAGGTVIAPTGFLVIVKDASAFAAAYGSSIPVAGEFSGALKNSGETLKLVQPGATPEQDVVIDEVTYDSAPPWPAAANGFGPSLQLIDPTQDNNRAMNWAVGTSNAPPPSPQWQYVSQTGTAQSPILLICMHGTAGDVYVDDLMLVAGPQPEVGTNLLANGDFESALTGPWTVSTNMTGSVISAAVKHSGNASLHVIATSPGDSIPLSIWQDTAPIVTNGTYTLSYWYLPSTNGAQLLLRLSKSTASNGDIYSLQNIQPSPVANLATATPGAVNTVRTNLPAFPLLWLNEIQPNNLTGIRNNFNERDPWVELYNSGPTATDLTGYYLTDTYSNLVKWPFPSGSTINPGQFRLVWLDGQPGQTSGTNLHANFRASSTNGSMALSYVYGGVTNVIDYLNYGPINNDRSFGAYPDGTPSKRHTLYYPTPGGPNSNSWPLMPVVINEWMASNNHAYVDPASGKYSDWLELYNAGPTDADLAGYYLANSVTNPTQFLIPPGYTVPAGGFLLVWADSDTSLNQSQDPALHVNFKLSAGGETIALFTPGGSLIDKVVFPQQTNDISQGRWPDGNSGQYYFMPASTPGWGNVLDIPTNHPPVLAAIPDQVVYQGSTLTLTATASDPDVGDTLSYSLDLGAPPTAAINPSSGLFVWTPTQANPPASYLVTVRVTDSRSPPLSDTTTVAINVLAPPVFQFTSASIGSNGAFSLTWGSQPQKTYRVSFTSDLAQGNWTPLEGLTATGTELSFTNDVMGVTQRFYRIELLNP